MSDQNDPSRPSTFDPGRPASSRRPRTANRRVPTARPDTGASGIGELPDQQFFAEGEDFEEEEEDYEEEEEAGEGGVFAFARPKTAAVGGLSSGYTTSDYGTSAPNTGLQPTTAGTYASGATFGISSTTSPSTPAQMTPTGEIDVGGRLPELEYDPTHPPPLSGRHNLNNSSFAFMNKLQNELPKGSPRKGKASYRPPTGQSLLEKLHIRKLNTASTNMTGTTDYTTTTDDLSRQDSRTDSDAGSFKTETTDSKPMPQARRMRSSAPLIPPSTAATSEYTSASGTTRGMSRGSYGLTEMTGDMTVPDGKTTWGDGMGGLVKEGSDEGSLQGIDLDITEEDSPYAEVRASVSNLDDPDMPVLTFRTWFLGLFFAIVSGSINVFFFFRTPSPYISPQLIQVVAYPCGKFLAYILPIRNFTFPRWLGGGQYSINPGPFNIKEHTAIVMMANASNGTPYALYMTVSSELWYNHPFGVGFNILFVLATQLTGFSFAGICRRFVIWPASMIWPGNLVVTTNFNTFHAEDDGYTGGMSRLRFFLIAGGCAFAYYFLPGFLFTALSYFSYACWIAPNNPVVNELFGVVNGLGLGILTFDWSQISWIGSPLVSPWWAEVNVGVGFIFCYWILVPIIYYNNVWETSYLPMNIIQLGDRFGGEYQVFNVLTEDLQLNKTAYAEYSPVYLSASYSMSVMLAFALASSLIVHSALHHGPRLYRAITHVRSEPDDIHMKLMRNYPEVPDWWFGVTFVICLIIGIVGIEVFHTGLPIWGYLLAILLPAIYVIPSAIIYAMTSQSVAINVVAELIPGYLFQSQPIPGMVFKVFGVQSIIESMNFLQDMKLGHYMKIPPRATFIVQIAACSITCLVQVGIKELLFSTVPDVCGSEQQDLLTCNNVKTFFTASIVWGLIGPNRIFSEGGMYHPCAWAALVGVIMPIPLFLWVRKYPRSILRNWNLPVMFNGGLYIPPATGINFSSWFAVGFVFQFWIRRRRFAWWSKYNYVLSAALDVGTALSALVIFLALDIPGLSVNWWGNTVYQNTADWQGTSALRVAPATGVGPDTWKI